MKLQTKKHLIKALDKVVELKLAQVTEIKLVIFLLKNDSSLSIKEMREITRKLIIKLGYEELILRGDNGTWE